MRRLVSVLVPLGSLLVVACSSAAPATSSRPAPATQKVQSRATSQASTFSPWTTYHRTRSRSGRTARAPGAPLHRAWSRALGNAVYGEPLVVGSTLIAATEGNKVFGLDARTGKVRWRTSLGVPQRLKGLPCGNIDPLGVTGTPAYDGGTGSVFIVAETRGGHHTLWALGARTGHKRWHRSLDVLPDRNRRAEQERSAVLVAHGRVMVSFGGLAGDCDNYVGYVTSTSVEGTGRIFHYAVPTPREAGMWSTPGPVLGRNGHVYVASGNGARGVRKFDKSDSVTELTVRRMHRVSVFAPSTWRDDNQLDLDLGSMSPAMVPGLKRIVIAGKRGVAYLLREHSHGVGSAIRHLAGCHAFGGSAVVGRTVLMPCLGESSIRALHVRKAHLRWGWSRPNLYGSPVVAGSRVYVADRTSGDVFVLRLASGRVLQRIHAGTLTHFPSEVVDGGFVFVPTLTGITAFRG